MNFRNFGFRFFSFLFTPKGIIKTFVAWIIFWFVLFFLMILFVFIGAIFLVLGNIGEGHPLYNVFISLFSIFFLVSIFLYSGYIVLIRPFVRQRVSDWLFGFFGLGVEALVDKHESVGVVDQFSESGGRNENIFLGGVSEELLDKNHVVSEGKRVFELLDKLAPHKKILEGFALKYTLLVPSNFDDNFVDEIERRGEFLRVEDIGHGQLLYSIDKENGHKLVDLLHSKYGVVVSLEDLELVLSSYISDNNGVNPFFGTHG